jgi:hypothetical protein
MHSGTWASPGDDVEAVMKAVLALILIYIGTFLVAIQGGSLAEVQAAPQAASPAAQNSELAGGAIDPAKEADIRALLELVGARDQVQDSMTRAAEQYREKLLETVPNNQQGQAFVNTVITGYEKKFDVDAVTEQLISVYDKHYTDEEIGREIQESIRLSAGKAAKEALQAAKQENPGVGQNARLAASGKRFQGRLPRQTDGAQQSAQQQEPQ